MAGHAYGNNGTLRRVFAGGAASKSTGGPSTLNVGEIGLFLDDGLNTRVTEANAATAKTAGTNIIIMVKYANGEVIPSPPIPPTATIVARDYTAATQFASYFGFNGTSGSITAANSTRYRGVIKLNETIVSSVDSYANNQFQFDITSDASATQEEIATAAVKQFIANTSERRIGRQLFDIARVASTGSDLALGTGVGDVVFTHGSQVVSADDVNDATTNASLAVGDYIRVGTAATDAVYKIVAWDTTNNLIKLDIPYQGATATIADTGLKRIPAADIGSEDWGIKVLGVAMASHEIVANKTNYGVLNGVAIDSTSNMGVTNSTAGKPGSGTYEQARQMESWGISNLGNAAYDIGTKNAYDKPQNVTGGLTSNTYDVWDINFKLEHTGLLTENPSLNTVTLLVPADRSNDSAYAATGTANDISDCLEAFVAKIDAYDNAGDAKSSDKLG